MILDRKLIAIIPARGGSKGIPNKNLYPINGKSLVQIAIELAKSNTTIDSVYVSTDTENINAVAREFGANLPKLRPSYLASDGARTIDVIANLVSEGIVNTSDILILLQPTSPLRTSLQLKEIIKIYSENEKEIDAVVSVCKIQDPHPLKTLKIEDGILKSFFEANTSVPRQELPGAYRLNGAFYLIKVDVLLNEGSFVPKRTLPFEMDEQTSVNLDSPIDVLLLEAIIGKKHD